MIGKFGIGFTWKFHCTVYGAAGSVVIILIWVYYSAIILYFGAEFTKVYANAHGNKIIPNYAVAIKVEVVELKKKMLGKGSRTKRKE
jgi:membrane protein